MDRFHQPCLQAKRLAPGSCRSREPATLGGVCCPVPCVATCSEHQGASEPAGPSWLAQHSNQSRLQIKAALLPLSQHSEDPEEQLLRLVEAALPWYE